MNSEFGFEALIDRLSSRLKNLDIKGMSPTNLRKFREFYLSYAEIQQAVPVKSLNNEGANIYASEYQLYLPSKEELQQQLKEIEREFARGELRMESEE